MRLFHQGIPVSTTSWDPSSNCEFCKDYAKPHFSSQCSLTCPRRHDWEIERAKAMTRELKDAEGKAPCCEYCKELAEPIFNSRCSLDCLRRHAWELERAQTIPVLAGQSNPLRICECCREAPKAKGNMRYCSRSCRNRSQKARAREAKLEAETKSAQPVGIANGRIAEGMSLATSVSASTES